MSKTMQLDDRRVMTDEYFGGCPLCGSNDGYLNIGREHWFYCDRHKARWLFGSNLFSGWREETEEDWQRNRDRLATFFCVEPLYPERAAEELSVKIK